MVLPGTAWFIKKNRIYSCRVTVQKVCAHTALTVRKHRFSRHRSICITNLFVLQFLHGSACKAQAMFIHKYGKEKFFYVHDKLHEVHDFKKTQEILGTDAEEGLKILERYL